MHSCRTCMLLIASLFDVVFRWQTEHVLVSVVSKSATIGKEVKWISINYFWWTETPCECLYSAHKISAVAQCICCVGLKVTKGCSHILIRAITWALWRLFFILDLSFRLSVRMNLRRHRSVQMFNNPVLLQCPSHYRGEFVNRRIQWAVTDTLFVGCF